MFVYHLNSFQLWPESWRLQFKKETKFSNYTRLCTVVHTVLDIWLNILRVFGEKICHSKVLKQVVLELGTYDHTMSKGDFKLSVA